MIDVSGWNGIRSAAKGPGGQNLNGSRGNALNSSYSSGGFIFTAVRFYQLLLLFLFHCLRGPFDVEQRLYIRSGWRCDRLQGIIFIVSNNYRRLQLPLVRTMDRQIKGMEKGLRRSLTSMAKFFYLVG